MPSLGQSLRRLIVGERLPTSRAIHERLPKYLALPTFAADAISSSAYAVEEILLVLVLAGSGALGYSTGVMAAIAALFTIVAVSYRQTVTAYPAGGGAYIVARENLGLYPGLIAAAALLTDYVLTVAVSIASGVAAVVSAAPALAEYRVELCLCFIAFITIANLRGVRESGRLFAGPTYLFVASMLLMLIVAAAREALAPGSGVAAAPLIEAQQPLTIFILLRAFASGCAALTGTEAIANSVPSFRPPESRNAATTLMWMLAICVVLNVGEAAFAQLYHLVPDPTQQETILSVLGRTVFGKTLPYYVLQAATAVILTLAATTSFAGFPRLASILGQDGVAPRQLANLGDRLVFNNGIVLLGLASALLVVIFKGMTHALIPLYAVGVFIAFTLSQAGMVRHWQKLRTPRWRLAAVVNAIGSVVTGVVVIVVASVKFIHGAWIALLLVPILVATFLKISQHYRSLAAALTMEGFDLPRALTSEVYQPPRAMSHAVLVLVPGLHRGVVPALLYAKSICSQCQAVFVEMDPADTAKLQEQWRRSRITMPLIVLKSPWRSLIDPIIEYIRTVRVERHVDMVTVVIPEYETRRWWHKLLHNQAGLLLKFALMSEPGVVVTNVRYHVTE